MINSPLKEYYNNDNKHFFNFTSTAKQKCQPTGNKINGFLVGSQNVDNM